ncbi:hypothetical protein JCM8547_008664 [Rhodosporidiobolus lusitaniae]
MSSSPLPSPPSRRTSISTTVACIPASRLDELKWTLEFELFYRLFQPDVWTLLEADDADNEEYSKLLDERIEAERILSESGPSRLAEARQVKDLMRERYFRWSNVLGLHTTRRAYFESKNKETGWTETEIIASLPPGQLDKVAPAPAGSWIRNSVAVSFLRQAPDYRLPLPRDFLRYKNENNRSPYLLRDISPLPPATSTTSTDPSETQSTGSESCSWQNGMERKSRWGKEAVPRHGF